MTVSELSQELWAMGPQEANVIFRFLADHVYEAELPVRLTYPPHRLRDVTDFREWLLALAEAAKPQVRPSLRQVQISDQHPRRDRTCPRCGHVHEGDVECGALTGGGRVCRCELEVPA